MFVGGVCRCRRRFFAEVPFLALLSKFLVCALIHLFRMAIVNSCNGVVTAAEPRAVSLSSIHFVQPTVCMIPTTLQVVMVLDKEIKTFQLNRCAFLVSLQIADQSPPTYPQSAICIVSLNK